MQNEPYAGFWIRVLAALIDSIMVLVVIAPLLSAIYGMGYWKGEAFVYGPADVMLSYVAPALFVILFWIYKSATPGKMFLKLEIVDAATGGRPSTGRLIKRYFAYYLSLIPFCLGFFSIGRDERKQGWHDKVAGTLVIRRA